MFDVNSILAPLTAPVEGYLASHPHLASVSLVILPATATVINVMLRIKTVAAWEADAERYPRFNQFAKLMRAYGVDPVIVFQAVVGFILGRAGNAAKKS